MYDIIFVCVPSCCIVLIRRKVVESITLLSFVNPIEPFPFLSFPFLSFLPPISSSVFKQRKQRDTKLHAYCLQKPTRLRLP